MSSKILSLHIRADFANCATNICDYTMHILENPPNTSCKGFEPKLHIVVATTTIKHFPTRRDQLHFEETIQSKVSLLFIVTVKKKRGKHFSNLNCQLSSQVSPKRLPITQLFYFKLGNILRCRNIIHLCILDLYLTTNNNIV